MQAQLGEKRQAVQSEGQGQDLTALQVDLELFALAPVRQLDPVLSGRHIVQQQTVQTALQQGQGVAPVQPHLQIALFDHTAQRRLHQGQGGVQVSEEFATIDLGPGDALPRGLHRVFRPGPDPGRPLALGGHTGRPAQRMDQDIGRGQQRGQAVLFEVFLVEARPPPPPGVQLEVAEHGHQIAVQLHPPQPQVRGPAFLAARLELGIGRLQGLQNGQLPRVGLGIVPGGLPPLHSR